jgi:hypothetical protein
VSLAVKNGDRVRTFTIAQDSRPVHDWGPSKAWTYTDKAGHAHRYDDGYPTLVEKTEHVPCDDFDCGCAGYDRSWHECARCGEVIRPSVAQVTYRITGRASYEVDGVPVTREDYFRQLCEIYPDAQEPGS